MNKLTILTRLLLSRNRILPTYLKYPTRPSPSIHCLPKPHFDCQITRSYSFHFSDLSLNARVAAAERALQEHNREVARERAREREERIKAGLDTADLDAEEEEDYMDVGPLIEKFEKEKAKGDPPHLDRYEEPTDSDSDDDDERFSSDAIDKQIDQFEKKKEKHEKLVYEFTKAGL